MDTKLFLQKIQQQLKECGISSYKSDSEKLMAYVLGINVLELFFVKTITSSQKRRVLKLINKRKLHMPLQYIMGEVEFLDNKFYVNRNVLIPRNETELLADIVIKHINKKEQTVKVLDLCTGSGVLGITIKHFTKSVVHLSDISKQALKVARNNTKLNKTKVKIIQSNLFKNIREKYNIIVSNPPYIKLNDITTLDNEVKNYEPILALSGGITGLLFYEKICAEAKEFLYPQGEIFFEIGVGQENDIKILMNKYGFKNIKVIKDYNNINRFVYGQCA